MYACMLCGCFPAMEIHIFLRCLSARLLSVPVSTVPCGHGNTYRAACYPDTFVHVWILQRFAPSYVRPVYCHVHDAVRILMCKSNLRVQCAQNVQILLFFTAVSTFCASFAQENVQICAVFANPHCKVLHICVPEHILRREK